MTDNLLDDCLVTFIERDILDEIDEDDVIKTFMSIKKRRPKKQCCNLIWSSFCHAYSKLSVCYLNYFYLHLRLIMLFSSCVPNCETIFMILYRIAKWILPVCIYKFSFGIPFRKILAPSLARRPGFGTGPNHLGLDHPKP